MVKCYLSLYPLLVKDNQMIIVFSCDGLFFQSLLFLLFPPSISYLKPSLLMLLNHWYSNEIWRAKGPTEDTTTGMMFFPFFIFGNHLFSFIYAKNILYYLLCIKCYFSLRGGFFLALN